MESFAASWDGLAPQGDFQTEGIEIIESTT